MNKIAKMKTKNKTIKNIKTFEEHLGKRYGPVGFVKRIVFEIKAKAFAADEGVTNKKI